MAYNVNVVDIPNLKANDALFVYEELTFDNSIFGFNNADETWANYCAEVESMGLSELQGFYAAAYARYEQR